MINPAVSATSFLPSAVEITEMVIIVVGRRRNSGLAVDLDWSRHWPGDASTTPVSPTRRAFSRTSSLTPAGLLKDPG
jgi:hypothetical protein